MGEEIRAPSLAALMHLQSLPPVFLGSGHSSPLAFDRALLCIDSAIYLRGYFRASSRPFSVSVSMSVSKLAS
jgi:hypothetical protein